MTILGPSLDWQKDTFGQTQLGRKMQAEVKRSSFLVQVAFDEAQRLACSRISEVEVFCPRVRFRKSTKRGPVWFIESMSPGYLFARFDYLACHRQMRQRPGVSDFVHFGERFALSPDALISEIKSHTGTDEILEISHALEPGQEVELTRGPFEGLRALVTRLIPARERIEVLIEWMARTLRAEAGVTDLEPVTGARFSGHRGYGCVKKFVKCAQNK